MAVWLGRRIWTVLITTVAFLICLIVTLTAYQQSDAMAVRKGAKRRNPVSGDRKTEEKPDPNAKNFTKPPSSGNARPKNGGKCPFGFDKPRHEPMNERKVNTSNKSPSDLKGENPVQSFKEFVRGGEAKFLRQHYSHKPKKIIPKGNKLVVRNSQELWGDWLDFLSSSEHVTPVRRHRKHGESRRRRRIHRNRLGLLPLGRWLT